MGSDKSHFTVSVIARNKVTKTVSTVSFEEKGEPKREIEPRSSDYQPKVLPLSHTGSCIDQPVAVRTPLFMDCLRVLIIIAGNASPVHAWVQIDLLIESL